MPLFGSMDGQSLFVATASSDVATKVNMKNFGTWLKENAGLRGRGGAKNTIQGGGTEFDPDLKEQIKDWLKQQ